jgi:hypothetical protein
MFKNERLVDGILVTVIIIFVTYILSQAALPYLLKFFKHLSQLSIGI